MSINVDWAKMDGLVPAIVQDADTGEVLMLGYMNEAALEQTREIGKVTFFSRSKQRLWTKGETSGNVLTFVEAVVDCDADTILVRARPAGPTCHTNAWTCFGDEIRPSLAFLGRLDRLIETRERDRPAGSYTTKLFEKGTKRIAQKVGEEGVETALAATAGDREELINESADLLYHLTVLLRDSGLSLEDVAARLAARHSGH